MPSLYLPTDHTDADLVLAGQLAEQMECAELFVTWTPSAGQAAAEVVAVIREPAKRWTGTLRSLMRAVGELIVDLTTRRSAEQPALPPQTPSDAHESGRHPAAGETAA
jgi:hypothetical protein